MKKLHFFLTFFIATLSAAAQSPSVVREYVEKFKDIAMLEMIRTGVPASITLAQGIHETGAGKSVLVVKSNNHFGIKCKSEWKGESVSHDDDARGECFRKYDSPLDSYRDHSDFLRNRSHYASLFNLDPTDYEGWAYGLKKAGYATNPKYPQILIKLIRDYNLQDYTLIALGKKQPENGVVFANSTTDNTTTVEPVAEVPEKEYNYPSGVFKINDTKVIFIPRGTSYLAVANEHHISLSRLFEFNDMMPEEAATRSHLLYLQRKRKTGDNEYHVVEAGQTLHDISQVQGIRLESLLYYNLLKEHMQPAVGEKLYLRSEAAVMPRLASDKPITTTVLKEQTSQPAFASYQTHTVQPKETMYALTKKYNVSAEDIMKWNDMETTDLKTGQVLRIYKKD